MSFWTLRRRVTAVLLTLVLLGAGWAAVVVAVAVTAARDQATTADAIAVLGAAQYNGHPSPRLGLAPFTSPATNSPIHANPRRNTAYMLAEGVKVPVAWLFQH